MNTKEFIQFFKNSQCPTEDFKQGIEWELFLVNKETLMPIEYYGKHGIASILSDLSQEMGGIPVFENDNIVGLKVNNFFVSLEGGGQIELSSTAYKTILELSEELEWYLRSIKDVSKYHGVCVMASAYHPKANVNSVKTIPKARYERILDYFKEYGEYLAFNMVKLTTSIQSTIDYSSEIDFVQKLRVASLLVPVFSAIYSNSIISDNNLSGFISFRGNIWQNTESLRSGHIKNLFEEDFGYSEYVSYLLSLPMINGFGSDLGEKGIDIRKYVKKNNIKMTDIEWADFLSYSYTDVRAKKFIEIRCFDNQPSLDMLLSVPALIKGIFYTTDELLNRISECLSPLSSEYEKLKTCANLNGLNFNLKNISMLELSQEIYNIAKSGLALVYPDEVKFIEPLEKYLFDLKMSPGEFQFRNIKENKITINDTIKGYLL